MYVVYVVHVHVLWCVCMCVYGIYLHVCGVCMCVYVFVVYICTLCVVHVHMCGMYIYYICVCVQCVCLRCICICGVYMYIACMCGVCGTCVWCMYMVYTCTVYVCMWCIGTGSFTEPGAKAGSQQALAILWSLSPPLQCWVTGVAEPCLAFSMGSGDSISSPPACSASVLAGGAISTVPLYYLIFISILWIGYYSQAN